MIHLLQSLYRLIVKDVEGIFLDTDQVFEKAVRAITGQGYNPCYGEGRMLGRTVIDMICAACNSHSCVSQVPVFQNLSAKELGLVESIIESSTYARGSLVFREGEQSESLFVVKSGLIKLTQTSKEGKQHILRFLFPGDYFGQFALLHHKRNHVTAEVIEASDVCRLHRKDFLPLVEGNAALAFSFMMSMSEQLQQAEELAGAMHIFEVEKRLARLLVYLFSRNQKELLQPDRKVSIDLPAAKKEFAAMIGTTAETLSRKLNKLESMDIIEVHKRTVKVLDIEALYQMAEISEK